MKESKSDWLGWISGGVIILALLLLKATKPWVSEEPVSLPKEPPQLSEEELQRSLSDTPAMKEFRRVFQLDPNSTEAIRLREEEKARRRAFFRLDDDEFWDDKKESMEGTKGGMEKLSKTLGGLESTLADVRGTFSAKFAENFMEGEKAAVGRLTELFAAFMEPIARVGAWLGKLTGKDEDK